MNLYCSATNLQTVYIRASDVGNAHCEVLLFFGYAGWRPGQLDDEIQQRGCWGLAEACTHDIMSPKEPTTFWSRIIDICDHQPVKTFALHATQHRFQLIGEPWSTEEDEPEGWGLSRARVTWAEDDELSQLRPEEEMQGEAQQVAAVACQLSELMPRWEDAVRAADRERSSGQLEWVKGSLGPMPSPELRPGPLAFWAAAPLNPLPALGVAHEIRPAVLMEPSTLGRLKLVARAYEHSIRGLLTSTSSPRGAQLQDCDLAALQRFEAELKTDDDLDLLRAVAFLGLHAAPQLDVEACVLRPLAALGYEFLLAPWFLRQLDKVQDEKLKAMALTVCSIGARAAAAPARPRRFDDESSEDSLSLASRL